MNENLKPLYLNVETGKIVAPDEQPSAGAIVAHLIVDMVSGDLTCDMNACEINDYISAGTPVFLQSAEGDLILTTADSISHGDPDPAEVKVTYRYLIDGEIIKVTILSDGSVETTEKGLGYEVRVEYDAGQGAWVYECDLTFGKLVKQIGSTPVTMFLLGQAGEAISSSMCLADDSAIYFRVWVPKDGWGTVVIGDDDSVSLLWDQQS